MQQAETAFTSVPIPGTGTNILVRLPRPALTLTRFERNRIEREIEVRLALLDTVDGDTDLEFGGDEFEDSDVHEDDDPREDDELAAAVAANWPDRSDDPS